MSVKEKQATIAHFSAVEDDLEKFFEINLNFIYCSGIAVSKQIKVYRFKVVARYLYAKNAHS